MESQVVYFDSPGAGNTDDVLRIVRARAKEVGIRKVVIASTTGATAVKAVQVLEDLKVVAVAHPVGFAKPNFQEFTDENRALVERHGGRVVVVTPVFGGLSAAMAKKFKTIALGGIIASTVAIFGEGMREACEAVVTAADAGLARTDEPVIAIGGSGAGVDTAVTCKPVNALDFWDFRIGEILCKPRFL